MDSLDGKQKGNEYLVKKLSVYKEKTDNELVDLVKEKKIRPHELESLLDDDFRAVQIRRSWFSEECTFGDKLDNLPYNNFDYSLVKNACCENVLGHITVPVGYAGPLFVDGKKYFVPMATTEGCLVASTNRGCRALSLNGIGVRTVVFRDAMTRAPVVAFSDISNAYDFKCWIDASKNFQTMEKTFNSTSSYAKLEGVDCTLVGRYVYLRFRAQSGDAMGMNMVSKGTEAILKMIKTYHFPDMDVVSLSGNYCVDKKPSAMNWIEGRGKSVTSEAIVPAQVVQDVLKTTVESMVHLNTMKNLVGSAIAGAIGGFNAHSSNIVTAMFLATGQDVAQNVTSSSCITLIENHNGDLRISCTMPCLEVGTVGGGTHLPAQKACLEVLNCAGGNEQNPGENAKRLASIICATVLAGELSLMAALSSGDLVKSHLKHNRSAVNLKVLENDDLEKPCSSGSASAVAERLAKTLKIGDLKPESCSRVLT